MPIELSTESRQEPVVSHDTAIACLARLSGQIAGAPAIETAPPYAGRDGAALPLSRLVEFAAELGLRAEPKRLDWQGIKGTGFADPLLIVRKDGNGVLVTGGGRTGAEEVSVWDPHHDGVVFFISRGEFERAWGGDALLITPKDRVGDRVETSGTHRAEPAADRAMRAARASQIRMPAEAPRRSLGLRLALMAGIVATASIGIILHTQPGAGHSASASTPAGTDPTAARMSQREAMSPLGAEPTAPMGPNPEAASTLTAPSSASPAN
jgi:hypothetical protein